MTYMAVRDLYPPNAKHTISNFQVKSSLKFVQLCPFHFTYARLYTIRAGAANLQRTFLLLKWLLAGECIITSGSSQLACQSAGRAAFSAAAAAALKAADSYLPSFGMLHFKVPPMK